VPTESRRLGQWLRPCGATGRGDGSCCGFTRKTIGKPLENQGKTYCGWLRNPASWMVESQSWDVYICLPPIKLCRISQSSTVFHKCPSQVATIFTSLQILCAQRASFWSTVCLGHFNICCFN
jgi:hypothetical protein